MCFRCWPSFWSNATDVFVVQFVIREETISAYLHWIDNTPPPTPPSGSPFLAT